MLEAYSLNVAVEANGAVPFNAVSLSKGCSERLASPNTVELNVCGVYAVTVSASAAAAQTLTLYKDGVAQPQAQGTGTTPGFSTLVQADRNNTCCPCSSPTRLQVVATDAGTLTNANITVRRVCV